jgi:hypothetical protein
MHEAEDRFFSVKRVYMGKGGGKRNCKKKRKRVGWKGTNQEPLVLS